MKINILTIFPDMFEGWMNEGIVSRAIADGTIEINLINFRDYADNKHAKVDDYPFGGGDGMLLMPQPLFSAIRENKLENTHTIFPSPKGQVLNQAMLEKLAESHDEITFIAGRYEGIDQRVIDTFVDEQVSLGDYILTGGEIAIEVILDGIVRLLPGVLNNANSHQNDSFSNGLLEHKQYTRPSEYEGLVVPEVFLSGHHKKIEEHIMKTQIEETFKHRPDLFDKIELSKEQEEILNSLKNESELTWKRKVLSQRSLNL